MPPVMIQTCSSTWLLRRAHVVGFKATNPPDLTIEAIERQQSWYPVAPGPQQ